MNFSSIPCAKMIEFWIIPQDSSKKLEIGDVELIFLRTYKVKQNNDLINIDIKDKKNDELDNIIRSNTARLEKIVKIAKDGSAKICVKSFYGEILQIGEVEIGIDDKIEKTAKKHGYSFKLTDQLCSLLVTDLNFKKINESYFFLTTGAAAKSDFNSNESITIKKEEIDGDSSITGAGTEDNAEILNRKNLNFCLLGNEVRIPVSIKNINNEDIYIASKLINNNRTNDNAIRLAKGNIIFSDYTSTGMIKAIVKTQMDKLMEDEDGYLKKWDEYGEIEGELLLEQARAVGRIDYNNIEVIKGDKGVQFYLPSDVPASLHIGDELELTNDLPVYIQHKDMTWKEYEKYLEDIHKEDDKEKRSGNKNESFFAVVTNLTSRSIFLDLPAPPDDKDNFLVLSIKGEKIAILRRMNARKLILEGRSANPMIGPLIEEGGQLPGTERVEKIKPLSSFVKNKIFKHPPTKAQERAIEIALNTPDIALIQGPPGTGKTTVITAIIERLNQKSNKTRSIRGNVLVTGFQHDAVENIVSRLSVNSLPSIKFGKKSGYEESESSVTRKIESWCKDIANKIREKNPQIAKSEEQRRLFELFQLYAIQPSNEKAISLLDYILSIPRNILGTEIIDNAIMIKQSLNSRQVDQFSNEEKINSIRSLRITEHGFLDDGPQRAADVLEYLEPLLRTKECNILKQAIIWSSGRPLDFLNKIKKLKQELIIKHAPYPFYRINKARADVLEINMRVQQELNKKNSKNTKEDILANFLHELEDNPVGVERALADYNFVYASTVQQSEGTDIRKAKLPNDEDKIIEYDAVLVDEAARTSPRDLLIPMAQGKKIILVGDHRQLPHIIDEAVVKKLEAGENENKDYIENSMFRYLFNRLKKLQENDSICRTITLDAQFRMHPELGEFVSNQFYPPGERFTSPLPKKYFQHGLEGCVNKSMVWINVPIGKGKETQDKSKSRLREAEAESIATQLNSWINSEEGKKLSFGIISFYRAQVNAVYKALNKYKITKKNSSNDWEINDEYLTIKGDGANSSEEKLRIGTVDSFQGMEFDVVFLSIVRSQDQEHIASRKKKGIEQDRIAAGLFGHLLSENRLCVSMSRQKRLLVTVGDSDMFSTDEAKEYVTPLANYHELCQRQGQIFQG